ncbi:hypothetical protein MKW98_016456 [Papaver atlanticum]|uniref:Uncharacterized protein n=1 Tax=Papaver atlanticum TaxID=357466 RepID=A0AAD4T9F4_9MAGN|nr:hypothetical protein MKW98_016456 [Papaver atlanticum]
MFVPLTVFDRLADDMHVPILYAYKPPNPSNALLEQGIRKALSEYREWAGRFGEDDNGQTLILLNDEGMSFIEASSNCTLEQAFPFATPTLLKLSPNFEGVEELALVQLTRFTCGSLVLSFSGHHIVADGKSVSLFLNAWGQACRGLDIHPRPLCNRNIFVPRDPFRIEFDHRSVEIVKRKISKYSIPLPYTEDDLVQQVLHCTPEFIAMIKSKASSSPSSSFSDVNGGHRPPYSTSVCLVAHLWKVITRVWRLADSQTTYAKISVNGRRRLMPRIPGEYFGNMVLWAFAETQGKNLCHESLSHTAEIIHKEVTKVDNNYYKSYIDFANKNLNDDGLTPRKADPLSVPSCWPNLEIQSWLGFTYNDVDFGVGKHFIYMPSFDPLEAETYLVPSVVGDGSINVYITLFQQHQARFTELFYNIYGISSAL